MIGESETEGQFLARLHGRSKSRCRSSQFYTVQWQMNRVENTGNMEHRNDDGRYKESWSRGNVQVESLLTGLGGLFWS